MDHFNPPPKDCIDCGGMMKVAFLITNVTFFIPGALALQALAPYLFSKSKANQKQ